MSKDPNIVSMRERVRVVKVDLDNPDKEPEIVEQETVTPISLTDAALLGFTPGVGFAQQEYRNIMNRVDVKMIRDAWEVDADGPSPPVEGARVGDE